jgi:hypothetical protein
MIRLALVIALAAQLDRGDGCRIDRDVEGQADGRQGQAAGSPRHRLPSTRGRAITLLASIKRSVKRAEAGANGSFKVAFSPPADSCSLVTAHAVGSKGSRASVHIGGPPCPPPR